MRKIVIFIVLCLGATNLFAQKREDKALLQARDSVYEYYQCLKTICNKKISKDARAKADNRARSFFRGNSNKYLIANDLYIFEYDSQKKSLYPQKLFANLKQATDNRELILTEFIITSWSRVKVDQITKNYVKPYAKITCTKKYNLNGKTTAIHDTLMVDLSCLEIISIQNEAWTSMEVDLLNRTPEELLGLAKQYYSERKYSKAVSCYEIILQAKPNDNDASINLALMYIDNKIGKKMKKKERFAKAQELLERTNNGMRILMYYTNLSDLLNDIDY